MAPWTDTLISTVELRSSFRVIIGLFVASLINALLAWSVSFGGQPSLGRFVVVPYSFTFLIIELMALREIFKVLDDFGDRLQIFQKDLVNTHYQLIFLGIVIGEIAQTDIQLSCNLR